MSLESVIAENTATMRELIAALTLSAVTTVQPVKAEPKVKAATKVEAKASVVEETEEVELDTAAQPSYEEVAKAITTLAQSKGRDAAIAIFKAFGVNKLPEAKPEQYAGILAAAKAA